MNGSIRRLVSFDVSRHLRRKSFWIASIAVPTFLILLAFLIQASEGAIRKSANVLGVATAKFQYVDHSGLIDSELARLAGGTMAGNQEKVREEVRNGAVHTLIIYPSDVSAGEIQIIESNVGLIADQRSTLVARQLLQKSVAKGLESEQLVKSLTGEIEVNRIGYRNGAVDPGLAAVAIPMLFLFLYFSMTIFLGSQLVGSFAEEREQKIREVLFVNSTASGVFLARMIATALLGAIQLAIMVVPIVVAYLAMGASIGLPRMAFDTWILDPFKFTVGFMMFLLGVSMMVAIHAAVGASVRSSREGSGFSTLFIIAMFVPSYFLGVISENPESLAVQLMTYFPLTAPSALMFRNALGNITSFELTIGAVLVLMTTSVATLAAIRVYKGERVLPRGIVNLRAR